jgi:hypothetical protein
VTEYLALFVDLDDELAAFLLAMPGLAAEVGSRVTPAPLPQNSPLPAVTYQDISDIGDHTGPDGVGAYHRLRYQVSSWAASKAAARLVDGAVRVRMDAYRGQMGGRNVVCSRANTLSQHEPETTLWQVMSDYIIHVEK